MTDLEKDSNDKWDIVEDKGEARGRRVTAAQVAIASLLAVAEAMLGKEEETEGEPEVGSTRYHLELIVEFLTPVVREKRIQLPGVTPGCRPEEVLRTIYQEEFEQLPRDIREKFTEAETLTYKANQAAQEEEKAVNDYNDALKKINGESSLEEQLNTEQRKLVEIEDTENISAKIIEAQTFW